MMWGSCRTNFYFTRKFLASFLHGHLCAKTPNNCACSLQGEKGEPGLPGPPGTVSTERGRDGLWVLWGTLGSCPLGDALI